MATGTLWVMQAQATASAVCRYTAGQRHAILVFAMSPDREGALEHAALALAEHGWLDADISRSSEVDISRIDDRSPILQETARSAVAEGRSLLVDEYPIEEA